MASATPARPPVPRDPARTLAILWGLTPAGARGPRPARTADQVAHAALSIADSDGLHGLSMRRLGQELGVGTMTVYTYVQNRQDLLDLVVDRAYGEMYATGAVVGDRWQTRARTIAAANADLYTRHPWLLDVDLMRPVLGPGETRKYDLELRALEGIGLDDIALDATITLLGSHAANTARRARETARLEAASGQTDTQWWAVNAPVLTQIAAMSPYDVAARVGAAVGDAQAVRPDASAELAFGIDRIVGGIEDLLAGNRARSMPPHR